MSRLLLAWLLLAIAGTACAVDPDAYEPDDTLGAANPIGYSEGAQQHTFHVPSDVDWVKLYLLQGALYEVRVTPGADLRAAAAALSNNQYCVLEVALVDGSGAVVVDNGAAEMKLQIYCDDAAGGVFDFEPGFSMTAPDGTYYLRVRTLDTSAGDPNLVQVTGGYSLSVYDPVSPNSGRILGHIIAAGTSANITDAVVIARTSNDLVERYSAYSLDDGAFTLRPDAGDYQLRVFHPDYQSSDWLVGADVIAGGATDVGAITLTPLVSAQPPNVSNLGVVGTPTRADASLQASVDPRGAATTVTFEYRVLPSGSFQPFGTDNVTTNGNSASASRTDLTCGTSYEARVSATNINGTDAADSADEFTTFATAACQLPPSFGGLSADRTSSTARLHAAVNTEGVVTTVSFEYRPAGGSFTSTPDVQYPATPSPADAFVDLANLACGGASYEFRATATNVAGGVTSSIASFNTDACAPPGVSNLAANPHTRTTATIGADISSNGQSVSGTIDTRVTSAPSWNQAGSFMLSDQPLPQHVSADVTGLTCGTTYDMRIAFVSPAAGEVASTFQTDACALPTLMATDIPATNLNDATAHATVQTNDAPLEAWFEYRVAGSGGAFLATAHQSLGAAPAQQPYVAVIGGLACSTSYEYFAVAQNTTGRASLAGSNFTTVDCNALVFRDGFE